MDKFEKEIIDTLCNRAQTVMEQESLKNRIDKKIDRKQITGKKHYSIKKVVLLVATACMLLGAGVFASGKVGGLVSGFDGKTLGSKTTKFSNLSKEEDILGYQVQAVPQFSNGYQFKQMNVDKTYGVDEEGHFMKQYVYYELSMIYQKGDKKVYVTICKPLENVPVKNIDGTKTVGNIMLTYSEDTYKWVPEDYELTQADEENMKRNDYFISSGADEISEQKVSHVGWDKDGVHYSIMEYDISLGCEGMFAMAEEILQSVN